MKECEVSAQYGKDEFKQLHFYCDFCGLEMGYEEKRECKVEREKCPHCRKEIGDTERSVSSCFGCDEEI